MHSGSLLLGAVTTELMATPHDPQEDTELVDEHENKQSTARERKSFE